MKESSSTQMRKEQHAAGIAEGGRPLRRSQAECFPRSQCVIAPSGDAFGVGCGAWIEAIHSF